MRVFTKLQTVKPIHKRSFWKQHAVPKHVQPVVEQIKPIIYETLNEVYKPLLDKLTSIDDKLGKIENYIDNYAPKFVKNSAGEDVSMIDPKNFGK
jgi:hypothetical protein